MPHSLILNLSPSTPIPPGYVTGKHLHALFLNLVSSVDQSLGDRLHAQTQNKAFALSPLQTHTGSISWNYRNPIAAQTPCWWRIALLDDTLFRNLTPLWLNLNPTQPWHLGSADLFITSVLGTPQSTQPWANFQTYDQLFAEASDCDRTLSFQFITPTVFRQGNYDSALPTRDCIFNSLVKRWNCHSPLDISDLDVSCLFPSSFDIKTATMSFGSSKAVGCVGRVSYKIMGDLQPLVIKQFNTLADYAFYAGIGRKTPMGMGMVRRSRSSLS